MKKAIFAVSILFFMSSTLWAAEEVVVIDYTSTAACGFPIRSVITTKPKEHAVVTRNGLKFILLTGKAKVTMTNLNTGYQLSLSSPNTSQESQESDSGRVLKLTGNQLIIDPYNYLPVIRLNGRVSIRLSDWVIIQEPPSKETIDACRLMSKAAAPIPRTTPAPWGIPMQNGVPDFLGSIRLAGFVPVYFSLKLHTHSHLDIFVNGQPVEIPANLGLYPNKFFVVSPIHTHDDAPGVIHVEADQSPFQMTLGNFFDIWQVRFTGSCMGGYCEDATHPLRVYINGVLQTGDPVDIPLRDRDQIAIVYGADPIGGIPSSYDFSNVLQE